MYMHFILVLTAYIAIFFYIFLFVRTFLLLLLRPRLRGFFFLELERLS